MLPILCSKEKALNLQFFQEKQEKKRQKISLFIIFLQNILFTTPILKMLQCPIEIFSNIIDEFCPLEIFIFVFKRT